MNDLTDAKKAIPAEAMKMNSELRLTGTIRKLSLTELRDTYSVHPAKEVISEFTISMPVLVTNFTTLSVMNPKKPEVN